MHRTSSRRWLVAVALVALVLVSSRGAHASPRSPSLDVGIVTEVPLMVGGQATLELPYGFLLQGSIGAMPSAYTEAIAGVAEAAGADVSSSSPLIHAALDGSLVVELGGGFRPFRRYGLEILGGYTLVTLGGSADAAQVLQAAGIASPIVPTGSVTLQSTLHNVHASVGWRWVIADHLVVRTSLGYLQTLASSSRVGVTGAWANDAAVAAAASSASAAADIALGGLYTQYVKSPTVSLSLAYRF